MKAYFAAALALGLASTLSSAAHADITSAFLECTSHAMHAYAQGVFTNAPSSQEPVLVGGKKTCTMDQWTQYLDVTTSDRNISFRKVPMDGSSDSTLGFSCDGNGSGAEDLFQELGRFALQDYTSTWSDGSSIETRRVGDGLKCFRKLRDGDGNEVNYYWCIFTVDVSNDFTKALNL